MNPFKAFMESARYRYNTSSSEHFTEYLRKKGVSIGKNVRFYEPRTITIDITKACLLTIGDNVRITRGVVILTHGADWHVLREIYHQPFGSAGRVTIKNNVFVGLNSIILKDVVIHENSVIGAGSVVTKDVPPGTVVAGNPARPVMTIDRYYEKREKQQLSEARTWARAIHARYGRLPEPDDFTEFFHLFLKRDPAAFGSIPVRLQVDRYYDEFLQSRPMFNSFEDFLRYCDLS